MMLRFLSNWKSSARNHGACNDSLALLRSDLSETNFWRVRRASKRATVSKSSSRILVSGELPLPFRNELLSEKFAVVPDIVLVQQIFVDTIPGKSGVM